MSKRIRTLIVDDSERSRKGLQAILEGWPDIEVIGEAINGEKALQLIERHEPDVVIMDAQMPVLDGIQATQIAKVLYSSTRVVVLTMHAAYRERARAAGADAFLIKGCSDDELFRAITA